MPFSISAGVGFIALFGIAVLNGIVLIEHFKELKNDYDDMETLIKKGAADRMRAVLLTATAAALGFLPMAISTNVGAEVQRPLATVVIGGLVTSTLLTLVVLPVLYAYFGRKSKVRIPKKTILSLILICFTLGLQAQKKEHSLDELIQLAMKNNKALQASELKVKQAKTTKTTAFDLDKTYLYYNYDQNNFATNNRPLEVFGVQQDFLFPTVYFANKRVKKQQHLLEIKSYEIEKKSIQREVTAAYYNYQVEKEKERIYLKLDSLYSKYAYVAQRRFELGETNYLEKITAAAKQRQIRIQYEQSRANVNIAYKELLKLMQVSDNLLIVNEPLGKLFLESRNLSTITEVAYYRKRNDLFDAKSALEKQRLLPDLNLEYFQGTNSTLNEQLYGYQLGLKIPLFFWGKTSRIRASKIGRAIAEKETQDYEMRLKLHYEQLVSRLGKYNNTLDYYHEEGLGLSNEILETTESSFKSGEIDFFQYLQSLENGYTLQLDYLDSLNLYNQTVISLNYITL